MKFCPVCGTEYADEVKFCPRDGQTLRAADPSADFVGQVIAGRYHVTRKLGEGGMGAVYLAEHVKMGRMSAIKVMGKGMSHDPEAISRFNREAANASKINHPNCCAVYDFGETEDGTIYLAMEFIEGRTLSALLKETGPLPLRRAADLLRQCADALTAAQELGIVHRDLKPDNIMIVSQRAKDVVKVVDFGIAKAAESESGQKVTKTGLVVGTPEYMSPEQLSGDKLDGRSDIYSLALVFYRMITGALPFIADTAQETMIKRLTDEPMPLIQAKPDGNFPAALQPVMDKALARYPNDRYATAAEFASDVTRVAGAVSPTASRPAADTEAKTQVVRPEEMKTSGTKAPPPTRVVSPTKSKMSPVVIGVSVVVLALGGGAYAMKDSLFGPKNPPADSTTGVVGDSVQHFSQQDTTKRDTTKSTTDSSTLSHVGGTTNPGPGTRNPPPRDTTSHGTNPVTKIAVPLPSLDDILEASTRATARSNAERIYRRTDVLDSLRAEAAALVGQAYTEDANFQSAKDWLTRADQMFHRALFTRLIADADRNITQTRN
ncbi:MAG TPA: serine/threonine-protein kinase [Gemmatimonadales bacterium]|nr:serine/threonine-protein kinase [Gemmatimonadales bacterium]